MTTLQLGRLAARIDGARVALSGRMDDTSPLGELAAHLPAGDVVIDCGAIAWVNSFGMREWVRLMRVLRGRGAITLERVPETLMAQMNMISELASAVRVTSFHAQYVCPACGAEAVPLVDAVTFGVEISAMQMPPMPCPECGAAMEVADFPERYLSMFGPQ